MYTFFCFYFRFPFGFLFLRGDLSHQELCHTSSSLSLPQVFFLSPQTQGETFWFPSQGAAAPVGLSPMQESQLTLLLLLNALFS